jgi:histidinol phosphatase-like PHP family hydrolase
MKIHQIDLHYHAGRERAAGKSLRDYVMFAYVTGRRILGITDHANLHITQNPDGSLPPFTKSTENFIKIRAEMDALRSEFPEMQLFLGPELGPEFTHDKMEHALVEVSDYFICESVAFRGHAAQNSQYLLEAIERCSHIAKHTGRPAFLAHPFRSQMYHRYDTFCYGPADYAGPDNITDEEAADFLGTDLIALGDRARELNVPIEINGVTLYRAHCLNRPYFRDVVRHAYKVLFSRGVMFVPGSDQHLLSVGEGATPVPEDTFDILGLETKDIVFLERIGARFL